MLHIKRLVLTGLFALALVAPVTITNNDTGMVGDWHSGVGEMDELAGWVPPGVSPGNGNDGGDGGNFVRMGVIADGQVPTSPDEGNSRGWG